MRYEARYTCSPPCMPCSLSSPDQGLQSRCPPHQFPQASITISAHAPPQPTPVSASDDNTALPGRAFALLISIVGPRLTQRVQLSLTACENQCATFIWQWDGHGCRAARRWIRDGSWPSFGISMETIPHELHEHDTRLMFTPGTVQLPSAFLNLVLPPSLPQRNRPPL